MEGHLSISITEIWHLRADGTVGVNVWENRFACREYIKKVPSRILVVVLSALNTV